jgi:serine/threonine-protein kinase
MTRRIMGTSDLDRGAMLMGKYRVEKRLGEGAMGVVYAAMHVELGQRVAIKVMKPSAAHGEQKHRFVREARASVHLKTQHVARVLDVGTAEDGAPYIVMEHLDGDDLAAVLRARGPLPIAEAVEHVLQACEAVAEAHAAGIVHRDIKPANLFLAAGVGGVPSVKVLDFGISKVADEVALTGAMVLGSPLYMSPEQMRASTDVDMRSDVWALGVTLYELVAGVTPFHSDKIEIVCALVFQQPPAPLAKHRADVPPGFEAVIGQCLEKDRARRFPSTAALAAALVPYAPARAAQYAERAALALGVPVMPSRPTHVLPPEPAPRPAEVTSGVTAAVGAPAVTGSPLVTSALAPGPVKRRIGVVAAVLAVLGIGGLAGITWVGLRGREAPAPAGSGSGMPARSATDVPVGPPKLPAEKQADAGPEPAVEPSGAAVTAPPPDAGPAPRGNPPTPKRPAPGQPSAIPPPKPKRSIYEQ